jgi:hypothetical protein
MKPRTSLLELDVRVSPHPAPDNLANWLAGVDIIMTGFMYCRQVFGFPVVVISINMMKLDSLST